MVNKIPQLASFQSKLEEHSSIPVPELDGVAAGCHSSLRLFFFFFAVFFKTTAGLHTNSQASGDSLVKVTTSSVLCGLWRSQTPGKWGSGVPLDYDNINQRQLMVRQLGFGGANRIRTVPTKGHLWSDNHRRSP